VTLQQARGTFDVDLQPGATELGGAVGRFDLTKTYSGDLEGDGAGIMLSAGNAQEGSAGYVALETVTGILNGRAGGFALQQFGVMDGGDHSLTYVVVPGSGSGELVGITGALDLTIDDDGTHHYELDYELRNKSMTHEEAVAMRGAGAIREVPGDESPAEFT
jgi:hypothetical protein